MAGAAMALASVSNSRKTLGYGIIPILGRLDRF